jgi:hypothetical protein
MQPQSGNSLAHLVRMNRDLGCAVDPHVVGVNMHWRNMVQMNVLNRAQIIVKYGDLPELTFLQYMRPLREVQHHLLKNRPASFSEYQAQELLKVTIADLQTFLR